MKPVPLKIIFLTFFALLCFAANSVLNRLALGNDTIDAGSYIGVRLLSGAVTLWGINAISKRDFRIQLKGNPLSAFYLFLYGVAFSFAYRSLSAGTGAFILFGIVQTTMLTVGPLKGERPSVWEWMGLLIAITGLGYLVFPGLSAPDPFGAFLMLTAGVAWGFYTLRGKGTQDPLATTALNFILAVPMVLMVNLFTLSAAHLSAVGIMYALMSGAVASGVGYVVWYAALKYLSTTQAALVQLSVPVIAAFGGVVFMDEAVTLRLLVAGGMIIGGVLLAMIFGTRK